MTPGAAPPALVPFEDAGDFLRAAAPALEAREDEHNLILGAAIARHAAGAAGFPQPPALLGVLGEARAPRAAVLMTPPFPLVIATFEGPAVAAEIAAALDRLDPAVNGVLADVDTAAAFRDAWCGLRRVAVRRTVRERVHRADAVLPVPLRDGRLSVAGPGDFPLVVEWVRAFTAEAVPDGPADDPTHFVGLGIEQGDYFLWEEKGEPVGMAARARRTRRGICINSVYTPPSLRGGGVATSLVAELTRHLLRDARFCVLHTDLANPTANALYRRIGYRPVRDVDLHWFGDPLRDPRHQAVCGDRTPFRAVDAKQFPD